jgi:dihydrofolate reductase
MSPRITLIVAMAANRVIGRDNALPWRLPADLRRFKAVTMGHTLVMGRKTYESIGRPLPGRRTVVITRRTDWRPEGVSIVHSLEEALAAASAETEVFVAGGGEIFREALPLADRIHLTRIEAEVPGDTTFPDFDPTAWKIVDEEHHEPDAENLFPYTFQILDRA